MGLSCCFRELDLIFTRPQTVLFELVPRRHCDESERILAALTGLDHRPVQQQAKYATLGLALPFSPIELDHAPTTGSTTSRWVSRPTQTYHGYSDPEAALL